MKSSTDAVPPVTAVATGPYDDTVKAVVVAYLERNSVAIAQIPDLVEAVRQAFGSPGAAPKPTLGIRSPDDPAVPIKKSIADDHIICLEDGKVLTMLKRYIRTQFNMSPEQYRAKWGLPADYPLVAPAYARVRSAFAKKIGLGTVPVSGRRGKKG